VTQIADPADSSIRDSMAAWAAPQVTALATAPGRRIDLPGVWNLRDVGGYPVAGGGEIRWRTLLRSDALHQLDGTGLAALRGLGVRTIVDLRTLPEAEMAPSAVAGLSARTTHISLLGGDLAALPLELAAIYRYMINERGAAIADAVRVISAPGSVPAMVHCSAGKDRTGIVCALVLAAVGVPDDYIVADYALSSVYLDPQRTPSIGRLQASTGLGDEVTRALLGSPPALILDVLDRVRGRAGSAGGYLREHGLTEADLARLRAFLVG
jgi:protein-tyrosine phosphatase